MAKRKITIRLFRFADADLMSLYYRGSAPLIDFLREALSRYVNNNYEKMSLPPFEDNLSFPYSKVTMHLVLNTDDYNDAVLLEAITSIPSGYRNGFLKNLIRYYSDVPYCEVCYSKSLEDFEKAKANDREERKRLGF